MVWMVNEVSCVGLCLLWEQECGGVGSQDIMRRGGLQMVVCSRVCIVCIW